MLGQKFLKADFHAYSGTKIFNYGQKSLICALIIVVTTKLWCTKCLRMLWPKASKVVFSTKFYSQTLYTSLQMLLL